VVGLFTTLKFRVRSQNEISQFVKMSEARLVVAGVEICASGGSATAAQLGLGSGGQIIVPSSVFFPSLAAIRGDLTGTLGRDAVAYSSVTGCLHEAYLLSSSQDAHWADIHRGVNAGQALLSVLDENHLRLCGISLD
jgi:hypothetical protein